MSARRLVERLWKNDLGAAGAVLSSLLVPAELAYRAGAGGFHTAYSRGWLRAARAPVPVVSLGNLTVGGAGKTPVTRWVAERLRARGRRPAILHGGYAADEPALHRAWLPSVPVLEMPERTRAARIAVSLGADVLLLDDGFQHRALARDVDIVLVAAETWTPTPHLLPRGGWREPPAALGRADLVLVTRKSAAPERAEDVVNALSRFTSAPIARLDIVPAGWRRADGVISAEPPRVPVLLVAGLAEPDAFVENARAAGADVADVCLFPDHHAYSAADVRSIRRRAAGRAIATTEKDWIKLQPLMGAPGAWVLRQEVVPLGAVEPLDALLAGADA